MVHKYLLGPEISGFYIPHFPDSLCLQNIACCPESERWNNPSLLKMPAVQIGF